MLASVSFLRTLQFLQENVLVSKECTVNYVEIVEPHVNYLFSFLFCLCVCVVYVHVYACFHVGGQIRVQMCDCACAHSRLTSSVILHHL